jgi:NADH-quinone oxidoreductase subunit L
MDNMLKILMILVPALPFSAALLVAVLGPRILRARSHWPVVLALVASCLCSLVLLWHVRQQRAGYERVESYWTWVLVKDAYQPAGGSAATDVDRSSTARDFTVDVALRLDALTCIMLTMVTFISLLVAVYSVGYMRDDRSYWRFFAYIALFVFSMTMLVLVSNFLLLFVFWEAVGVCSYLLIGFWYEKPSAAAAGKKAFLVNRVGDFGFMLGVFLIWTTYGTLNYHDTPLAPDTVVRGNVSLAAAAPAEVAAGVFGAQRIVSHAYVGGGTGLAICLLLLLGACGKSAQFPLHVWLPDAMEGPTPVSALIHAATMVTAGVYMVARCTPLFTASPEGQWAVAAVGTFTALLAGLIALTQFDLKRVLAYSTISQLGYMFLGLGTGTLAGISAGMFHLFTHAFFKALLFLGAGSVMHAMGNVIDMRQLGGLRKLMPYTFWTFLIGCLALSGIAPLSGFWSKDAILASVHTKADALEEELAQRQATGATPASTPRRPVTGNAVHAVDHARLAARSELSDVQLARGAWIYRLLYFAALVAAFLTSVYTFRMLYLTFFGQQKVPVEAGGHAHESPGVMVGPLVILAVCAAGVGMLLDQSYLNGTHPFAALLATTPSLTGAVVKAETLGEFHIGIAATSLLVALAGVALSSYLYLGDRRVVRWLQTVMDLQALARAGDQANLVRLAQRPWARAIDQWAGRARLRWLVRLLVDVVLLVALVFSAPLLLARFVSPYRLSHGKFFLDELYNALVVQPLRGISWLCGVLDDVVVDGVVNALGRFPLLLGTLLRSMQTGLVQFYALAMILGGLVLLVAIDEQLGARVVEWVTVMLAAGGKP